MTCMTVLAALVISLQGATAPAAVEGASDRSWHRVVGLLQYLEGDYPAAAASHDASELAEQRGFADEVVQALDESGPDAAAFRERARAIRQAIDDQVAPLEVSALCHALAQDVIAERHLSRAPHQAPNLEAGAQVFAAACASCHGVNGDGVSAVAAAMEPKPANFHDAGRMRTLTPYKVFNTTTFGVSGTPMPAFGSLSESDRWNVAFFVMTLRHPPCPPQTGPAPSPASLEQLATQNDDELGALFGGDRVRCLRRVMPKVDERSSLQAAVDGVERAVEASKAGRHDAARQAIVDAYLLGVEPVEPTLRARNPQLVAELERAFTQARLKAQRGESLEADGTALLAVLRRASATSRVGDFWSVFITALLILLREGFEATIVVGALLAVLKKMGAVEQARVVHWGWSSALAFSALVYVFFQRALAGANREWMEALVSLLAVGMLLYAALWLNARANMSRFMGELREKMKSALGRGSVVGLFFISFTSVGRETLETVLFLEGLAGDSPSGVAWGAGAGLLVLLGVVVLVRRVGFVLPMKTLFKASTVLLVATAVMLVGKGFHGLQELGVLPLGPVPFVTVESLGVYPDGLSLAPQLVLALAPLIYWAVRRTRAKKDAPPPLQSQPHSSV